MIIVCYIGICYCDCGSPHCESWSDYYDDKGFCRSKGGVDKVTMILLNLIPLAGLSSFYSGKQLDGIFEAIHWFSTISSGVILCTQHSDCTGFGVCMIWTIVIVDTAKIVEAVVMKNWVELAIIITSFILSCCSVERAMEDRINMPRAASVLTASVIVMEWSR